ncbi:MaoC family dehydratase [Enterovibrio makurazakiensis]|uniref:MaoC family dehydratase n=1 Tax=Enterovibrio gelatinilyticus TaxID=2899819 RepID=A0ABT5R5W1_9GAMM|nr:MaoC family dehydratase [Enterovibrio sp. ZSDZ42]MDD1795374.1 MaoC family dehydratase [Enterovibrio sp. ZSDZ42]
MKQYGIDDIDVGLKHQFSTDITEEKLNAFTLVSGDINPLHTNAEHAKRRGHPDVVVYGMMTASLYSTLVGVYLPGENALLQDIQTRFSRPVFVGDVLTVVGEVVDVHTLLKRIEIKAVIRNQHGQVVSKARIHSGIDESESSA